ncbi:MAG: TIGR03560 family F420-dependent LLM class oxidoreductase [Halobacteriaceae archaeon]
MQFDWMVACYAGAGEHRDTPLLDHVEKDVVYEGVDTAVDVGIEGLWVPDHFMLGPNHEEYEVWTLLSALAERTDDVDLGPLVGCITYRNPALLAKMATTVDVLSEGRLRLGLGAGWHREEHQAFGYDFPEIGTRVDMLEEGLEVVTRMMTEDEPTFEGEHYRIDGAYNEPGPVQEPHVPIVIGGGGPKMLRLTAKYADEWNVEISTRNRGPPLEFKSNKLDEYMAEEGRDPSEMERSWLGHVLVRETEEEVRAVAEEIFPLPWGEEEDIDDQLSNPREAREKGGFMAGTPNQVADQIEEIRAQGFEKINCMFIDFPSTEGMELFGDEVIPQFQ